MYLYGELTSDVAEQVLQASPSDPARWRPLMSADDTVLLWDAAPSAPPEGRTALAVEVNGDAVAGCPVEKGDDGRGALRVPVTALIDAPVRSL